MTEETTLPFGVSSPRGEEGGESGELAADAAMLDAPAPHPVLQETALDARSDDSRRGRTRERTARTGHEANKFPLRAQALDPTDLASAAAAAEALAAATAHVDLSVDDLRSKEGASPEKKAKLSATTKMPPAPAFGGLPAASSGHHPPLFHGPPGGLLPSEPPPAPATEAPQTRRPEFFQLETEPSWLEGLRADLKDIAGAQRQMAKDMSNTSHELRAIQDGVRNLSVGQESLTRRADEQEAALQQMRREFQELEREMQTLHSAPPTRGPSPVSTPRGSGPQIPSSPRFAPREIDELQIVIGGWQEAKRQEIEEDVHEIFQALQALPLLKQVYVPYVRSGFCRVELVYPEQDVWKQRKLQGTVLEHIKALNFRSKAPGQERSQFWCSRNRTIQERAKIRAILSTQALCVKHLGEALVDKDWRGKLWANSVQVLHHVDNRRRPRNTLMLVDTRGNETGWFLDVDQISQVLGVSHDVVLRHYDAE